MFDECHKAKNLGVLSKSGKGGTKAARAVVDIQRSLPNARCLFIIMNIFIMDIFLMNILINISPDISYFLTTFPFI